MKRIFLASLLPLAAMAGDLSIGASAGYGLAVPGTGIGTDRTTAAGTVTAKRIEASPAQGFQGGLEFLYNVNPVVAIGMGARFQATGEVQSGKTSTTTTTTVSSSESNFSVTQFALRPTVVFSSRGESLTPYARFLAHVGMPSMTSTYDYSSATTTSSETTEMTGGIAFGYGAGLGLEYALSETVGLYGELVGEFWNWAPETAKLTESTRNGQDMLAQMDPEDIKTEYVDSFTYDESVGPVGKSLRSRQSYAATVLNLGVRFQF